MQSINDDDDAFFNRTGLERVGVVGREPGLLLNWSAGFGDVLLYKDKERRRTGGRFARCRSDA